MLVICARKPSAVRAVNERVFPLVPGEMFGGDGLTVRGIGDHHVPRHVHHGDPRSVRDEFSSRQVALLAWYDRDVAAVLFDSVRTGMEQMDDLELAGSSVDFLGWSMFDPRAAVARLEDLRVASEPRDLLVEGLRLARLLHRLTEQLPQTDKQAPRLPRLLDHQPRDGVERIEEEVRLEVGAQPIS